MNKTQFYTKVKNGHVDTKCRQSIIQVLRCLEGKAAKITIEERRKMRSLSQNAYYWGVVIPPVLTMFTENGNNVDAQQVHEFLKAEVGKLNQTIVLPDGEVKQTSGSTARLPTMAFEVYLEKIRAWAATWEVTIPLPHEGTTLEGKLPVDE